jgi:hypothetical protein
MDINLTLDSDFEGTAGYRLWAVGKKENFPLATAYSLKPSA